MRHDGRGLRELRPISLTPDYVRSALGSVLIECGKTRVICTASVESRTPPWLESGGWVTAEYAMLPGATSPRSGRKPSGRDKEIQRLIGRSLRAAIDLEKLVRPDGHGISIICDCDVLEADGGTRTASITGVYAALEIALRRLQARGELETLPILDPVAAVSVGVVHLGNADTVVLDLDYLEDSTAVVDMNVVQRSAEHGRGGYVELQGTGEGGVFDQNTLQELLISADVGIQQLFEAQRIAISKAVAP